MTKPLIMGTESLEVYIPIPLNTYGVGLDESIRNAIQLHQKAGFDRFILSGPTKGWRSIGYPPHEEFTQIAADILKFKEGLRDYAITVGWWAHMTLKTGPGDFQRIVNSDGLACPTSTCPLDKEFQERYANDVASVAASAEPALIIFEDDFGLNCHNAYACFCDLHMRFFSDRVGRSYTREEIQRVFKDSSDASLSLRRNWEASSRDSLVQFADCVRASVDQVTPWIPMGSMQPGCADGDGDSTEAIARAFAGDKHRPFVRLYGTSYGSDDSFDLPKNVFHALYSKQHLPDDVICYHESDTYPHSRFFMSSGKMRSLMGAVYSYGFAGSTFQACQELDAPNEEVGYYEMFAEERARFQAIMTIARRCELSGCGLLSAPKQENSWVAAFAHFGIPYTTMESAVNVLSGALTDSFSDNEIEMLLKKGLLLDGEAAQRLCTRGFGAAIGVSVEGKATIMDPGRDIEGRERIRDAFIRTARDGQLMTWFSTYSPCGNGSMYHLTPNDPNTEIVTDLRSFKNETVGIGMTRFRNDAGGRIVVMGMSVAGNLSSSLFNYRRARLIQDMVTWAGADYMVCVQNRPRVFCIVNRPKADWDTHIVALVTLINLCSDTFTSLELHIPREWVNSTTVRYLASDGRWQKAAYEFVGQTVRIDHSMPLYHPLYVCFSKATC